MPGTLIDFVKVTFSALGGLPQGPEKVRGFAEYHIQVAPDTFGSGWAKMLAHDDQCVSGLAMATALMPPVGTVGGLFPATDVILVIVLSVPLSIVYPDA